VGVWKLNEKLLMIFHRSKNGTEMFWIRSLEDAKKANSIMIQCENCERRTFCLEHNDICTEVIL